MSNYTFTEYVSYLTEGDKQEAKNFTMEDIKFLDKEYVNSKCLKLFNHLGYIISNYTNLDFVLKAMEDGFIFYIHGKDNILIKKISFDSRGNSGSVFLYLPDFKGESDHAGVFKFAKNGTDVIKTLVTGKYSEYKELEKLFDEFFSF